MVLFLWIWKGKHFSLDSRGTMADIEWAWDACRKLVSKKIRLSIARYVFHNKVFSVTFLRLTQPVNKNFIVDKLESWTKSNSFLVGCTQILTLVSQQMHKLDGYIEHNVSCERTTSMSWRSACCSKWWWFSSQPRRVPSITKVSVWSDYWFDSLHELCMTINFLPRMSYNRQKNMWENLSICNSLRLHVT